VTHAGGKELEEPLVIRPDLRDDHPRDVREVGPVLPGPPVLINQWANVDALGDAHPPLPAHRGVPLAGGAHRPRHRGGGRGARPPHARVYRDFMEDWIAMPPVTGPQEPSEKFAGAVRGRTDCEALMKDNKALQAGTSHFLGQNFSKASNVTFQSEAGAGGVRLEHLVGGLDATGGRDGHDPRRRCRPRGPAPPRADQVVIVPDLQERRGALCDRDQGARRSRPGSRGSACG
jgi:hypothetical protein